MVNLSVTMEEVRNALKGICTGKAAGEDGLTTDLLRDAGDFVESKLSN